MELVEEVRSTGEGREELRALMAAGGPKAASPCTLLVTGGAASKLQLDGAGTSIIGGTTITHTVFGLKKKKMTGKKHGYQQLRLRASAIAAAWDAVTRRRCSSKGAALQQAVQGFRSAALRMMTCP